MMIATWRGTCLAFTRDSSSATGVSSGTRGS